MMGLEFDKLLHEALVQLVLPLTAVTALSHILTTGVIMAPEDTGRVGKIQTPTEARKLPKRSIPLRARQDLLNGYWQRDTVNDENLPKALPKKEGVDMDGKTQEQVIQEMKEINGEEWYHHNRVRLENLEVWEQYLSLN